MSDIKKVIIVGPLAPPAGGMANQTKKLSEFLQSEGLAVEVIRTNADYKPTFVANIPVLRAVFRLISYMMTLLQRTKQADLVHIMANSGWSWHLFSAPAIIIARFYKKPVVLNYRGGYAEDFFNQSWRWVNLTLKHVQAVIVPSVFLEEVFAKFGQQAGVVPNVLDEKLFYLKDKHSIAQAPHIIVTRNLEAIYDVATTIKAFGVIQQTYPQAKLSIAGTGPELNALRELITQLSLEDNITFTGRLAPQEMAALYHQADVMLNASTVDNTPNSIIEALACGTPVVSTNVGGIPKLVTHQHDALLVEVRDYQAMAASALSILQQPELVQSLKGNGIQTINKFYWPNVWQQLKACYDEASQVNQRK